MAGQNKDRMLSRNQIASMHVWKQQSGLDDDAYRGYLQANFQIGSSKEMTQAQFSRHMATVKGTQKKKQPWVQRPDGITEAQNNKILALWSSKAKNTSFKALSAWLEGKFQVKTSRQLSKSRASDVITALERGGWLG